MKAGGHQIAEHAVFRGNRIGVIGQRRERFTEADDVVLIDGFRIGFKGFADGKILEIEIGVFHAGFLILLSAPTGVIWGSS